ncbi:MAG: inositol monophosphatase [Desulfobacterales bacterium]|nr:inositol monophosphatase [Desulfobacterales bacterium]
MRGPRRWKRQLCRGAFWGKGGKAVVAEAVEIEHLTGFAIQTIRDAGKEALSYYGKGNPDVRFDEGLVTEAELHLSDFFQVRLGARFPEHRIFNNNQEDKGYSHDGERYLWVFDALDGVANFQGGIPVWGISLALLENFWPIFGAFYMPVTGDLFHARAGQKAYWGDHEIHALSQSEVNDESVLLTYSRFHNHYRTSFPGKIRSLGSTAAHLCYVAGGQAEAAVIIHETFQDLAAARIIVEAAGAKIFRMNGDGFFLNEYLDGSKIDEHLMVSTPGNWNLVRDSLQPVA